MVPILEEIRFKSKINKNYHSQRWQQLFLERKRIPLVVLLIKIDPSLKTSHPHL